MKNNIAYILGIICLTMMPSCLEDTHRYEPTNPGDEVNFTLSIGGGIKTKTIYGDVVSGTNTTNALKVNWVTGDQIAVYGESCDRKTGEYKVTPSNGANAHIAGSITKVGDAGVQWGLSDSDFYAIYPSNGNTAFEPVEAGGVSIPMAIRSQQPNIFTKSDNKWVGTPCLSNDKSTLTMVDNIMYAYSCVNIGDDVTLNFKPYSSVLSFTLEGWTNKSNGTIDPMQITKITLSSDKQIAGNFTLALNGGTPSICEISSSAVAQVDILPAESNGSYLTISENQPLEFNVFTIPQADISIDEEWSIILTTSHGTFVYPLAASTDANNITPGNIHKITIPAIPLTSGGSGGSLADNKGNWIAKLDPTIYLSELSLPGAWYCYDSSYQQTTDIGTLYAAGVRAFHIDCRLTNPDITEYDGEDNSKLRLVCAGTDKFTLGGFRFNNGTLVEDKITEIYNQFKANTNEYVVIVLTIAEQYCKQTGINGGTYGTINPKLMLDRINTMLENKGAGWNVYGYTEDTSDKTINAFTTIDDVKGHIIVKINSNASSNTFAGGDYTLPTALVSTASLTSDSGYKDDTIEYGNFIEMDNSKIFWGKDSEGNLVDTGLDYYYIQAQKTERNNASDTTRIVNEGTPTIGTRKAAIEDLISESREQYETSSHNKWFQMGIGGNINGNSDHDELAKILNRYVRNRINAKIQDDPSPVGIVLMNHCTNSNNSDNYGPKLIDAILKLNESFIMKRSSEINQLSVDTKSTLTECGKSVPMPNDDGNLSGWMKVSANN